MAYCPHSGRTINDGDEFCANCARRLFFQISKRTSPMVQRGHWITCPKCHGTTFVADSDGHRDSNTKCGYPDCQNGRVWVED